MVWMTYLGTVILSMLSVYLLVESRYIFGTILLILSLFLWVYLLWLTGIIKLKSQKHDNNEKETTK
jgi:hypothetical protein